MSDSRSLELYEAVSQALEPMDDFFDLVALFETEHELIRERGKDLLAKSLSDIKKIMDTVNEEVGQIYIESGQEEPAPAKKSKSRRAA